ncbi:MAG: RecQ family ATP-dependent DNA helicase, partial [Chryseobacterium sp.]
AQTIGNRMKSFPGDPVNVENGVIKITEHAGNKLIVPLIAEILNTGLKGSSCILTQTNEEAVQTVGMLLRKGIPAKLIQTNDGFRVSDLFEVRQFSDKLKLDEAPPVISDEDWDEALAELRKDCAGSTRLDLALNAIRDFSLANTSRKYKSDWITFLKESKIEDFAEIDSETIFVSTIHKAKGKEFENVFLLLKDFPAQGDEKRRLIFVAVTRAKTNLSVHYNDSFLKPFLTNDISYTTDPILYPGVDQITIHMGHKDIFLGFFESLQDTLLSLKSGSSLTIQQGGLGNSNHQRIVLFSKKFRERLSGLEAKGFFLHQAKVNFVVYWKGELSEKEIKIILAEVILEKK